MKATEVYNRNKDNIHVLADVMRKQGRPGHIEDPAGVIISSFQPFEHELTKDSSTVASGEIGGIHTSCQVIPIDDKDMQMICVQTAKEQVQKIKKCVEPIAGDVLSELYDISLDYEQVLLELIPKVIKKQVSVQEAHNIMNTKLAKNLREEKEVLNYYHNYRDKKCGKINQTTTKIRVKDGKVIEV